MIRHEIVMGFSKRELAQNAKLLLPKKFGWQKFGKLYALRTVGQVVYAQAYINISVS